MAWRVVTGGLVMVSLGCTQAPAPAAADCPTPAPVVVAAPPAVAAAAPAEVPAGAKTWREPTDAVRELVDARPTPGVRVDPTGARALVLHSPAMPAIAEVARPFASLAGMRIDLDRRASRRVRALDGLAILDIATGEETVLVAPGTHAVAAPEWSPDGRHVAWLQLEHDRVDLYLAGADGSTVRRVGPVLDVVGEPFRFWRDRLLVIVPGDAPVPGERRPLPTGPVIEDATGESAQNRTYQDLLTNAHDEARFEAYATGRLAWCDLDGGAPVPFGNEGIFDDVSVSPDGSHVLVERVRRPFSYVVPYERFGRVVEVWNQAGEVVATLADQEPAETIPIDGVRTGARQIAWLPSEPSSLVWVEALDGGDPKAKVEHRDRLLRADLPSTTPRELTKIVQRATSVAPLDDGERLLVTEYDRDRRWTTTWLVPLVGEGAPTKLFDRSQHDAYGHPGEPVRRTLPTGHRAVAVVDGAIYLAGEGATADGDRPFFDRLVLADRSKTRIVESTATTHVQFVAFAGPPGSDALVLRRQQREVSPNLVVRTAAGDRELTRWPDPHPGLRGTTQQLLRYRRKDGVALSGTLHLPAGEPPPGGWPLLVWAYPVEYTDKDTAGQVRAATNVYPRITASSPLALLAAGYAVLDDAAMPVVGDPQTMNDTLLEQLGDAAAAAIDAAAATGAIDRQRVAVGGHSYGAFMTANLLAHTDLFKAGIARSGAYNRTLTPFGYQSERRTLWEAPDTYNKVSPLLHADRIDEPLLLIHGEVDDNSGTFPMQSQRLFSGIRGTGGIARLVVLPHEAHSYTARENLLHMLAEEIDWLDRHVRRSAG
jgi:dipeptidyl aminopeptidase/acylaminoacyl peptidase